VEIRCVRCEAALHEGMDPTRIVHRSNCEMRGNSLMIRNAVIALQRDGRVLARYPTHGTFELTYQGEVVRRCDVYVDTLTPMHDSPMIEIHEHPGDLLVFYTYRRFDRDPPIDQLMSDLTVTDYGVLRFGKTGDVLRDTCVFEGVNAR